MTRRRAGAALAATLAVIGIAVILTFTLSAISFSHLTLANRWHNTQRARNAADSVVSLAVSRLIATPTLGQSRSAIDDLEATTADGATARLTFSQDRARDLGIPWSTNNLVNSGGVAGWNRTVPQNGVHLLGSATVEGVTSQVEVVLHVPPFPYAIASTGAVKSDSGLIVARVSGPIDVRTFDQIPRDRLLPASIVSNSTLTEALSLGVDSRVTGDVQAAGGITLAQSSVVLGEVRQHADAVVIPRMDVEADFASLQQRIGVQTLEPGGSTEPIVGCVRSEGDVDVNGDMVLQHGSVYVNGNLTVRGGVVGKGAVYVKGTTTIRGTSDQTADNMTAIVSKGDITLSGASRQESSYRGLIYTEGNFTARNITLVGAFVANGQPNDTHLTGGSAMTMTDVRLVQQSDATTMQVAVKAAPTPQPSPQEMQLTVDVPICADGSVYSQMTWPGVDPVPGGVHVTVHIEGIAPNLRASVSTGQGAGQSIDKPNYGGQNPPAPPQMMPIDQAFDAIQAIAATLPGYDPAHWRPGGFSYDYLTRLLDNRVYRPGGGPGGGGGNGPPEVVLDLDLNRFLSLGDKLRLTMWKTI